MKIVPIEALSRYPAWKAAVDKFRAADFQYEDVVTHEWLYAAFDMIMPDDAMPNGKSKKIYLEYMNNVIRFREAIQMEDLLYLETEHAIGYRVTPPSEQTAKAMALCSDRMNKALRLAARTVGHIRSEELTDQQRRENMDARAKISSIAGLTKRIQAPF